MSETPPVAIVALSQGVAEIKHTEGDWKPAYWLTLVRPEDQIRTSDDGKLVLTFFHDYHREVVEPDTLGKIGRLPKQGATARFARTGRRTAGCRKSRSLTS